MLNAYGYLTGGADYVCFASAEALRSRGHEVAFLTTRSDRNVVEDGVFVDLRVTHFTRDQLSASAKARVAAAALWNRQAAGALDEAVRRYRPDLVHAHKLYPQLSVAPLVHARRRGLPIVQSLYDYELLSASTLDHTGGRVDRAESRFAYRALNTATFPIRRRVHAPAVAAWTCCSRFMQERYRGVGIEATLLPLFVELPPGDQLDFSEREGISFAGRLWEEKGVRDVVQVASAHPELPVTIAGGGPLARFVEQQARRLPNLRFLGDLAHDELRNVPRRARIALMPSRWQEPGGIAALEAMAQGTPVVAYASGGLAEYVGDADAGTVIAPDAERLASECERLYEDRARWERHSRAAISAARELSLERYVSRLESVFEQARSEERSPARA
jgi:glycosyltransferase involved in cell wall biosynthesis